MSTGSCFSCSLSCVHLCLVCTTCEALRSSQPATSKSNHVVAQQLNQASAPGLTCATVYLSFGSIEWQTLTARATRLESTTSRARLEAENEAYKRATIAKRRRALGPKNACDFMRQTIRDREKTREINRIKADLRACQIPVQAEPEIRWRRSLDQPQRGTSSEIALALPLRETTHSRHPNRSAPTSLGTSRASRAGRVDCDEQERPPTSTQKVRFTLCFTRDDMILETHSLGLVKLAKFSKLYYVQYVAFPLSSASNSKQFLEPKTRICCYIYASPSTVRSQTHGSTKHCD